MDSFLFYVEEVKLNLQIWDMCRINASIPTYPVAVDSSPPPAEQGQDTSEQGGVQHPIAEEAVEFEE